jgi:hypothetical protein
VDTGVGTTAGGIEGDAVCGDGKNDCAREPDTHAQREWRHQRGARISAHVTGVNEARWSRGQKKGGRMPVKRSTRVAIACVACREPARTYVGARRPDARLHRARAADGEHAHGASRRWRREVRGAVALPWQSRGVLAQVAALDIGLAGDCAETTRRLDVHR